jgi:uncharacterized membrane protein
MILLILLVALVIFALVIVSAVNRAHEKNLTRRAHQRKLKVQADLLLDVANNLAHTLTSPAIAKYIIDEAILLLQQIQQLETGATDHIETNIRHAQLKVEDLMAGKFHASASFQKDSDAQISQTQAHLNEAGAIVRHLCAQGKITDTEMDRLISELSWAYLMVSAASYIAQGHKFATLQDRFTAQGYHQKALQLLLESTHPDPRRVRIIKELNEILAGTRQTISQDLIPHRTEL